MLKFFIDNSNYIKILIFFTFIILAIFKNSKSYIHNVLFIIVLFSTINEIVAPILLYYKVKIALTSTFVAIIHHSLWILILYKIFSEKKSILISMIVYLFFSFLNMSFFEGINKFNTLTFTVGAMVYIVLLLKELLLIIKNEHFTFFKTTNFILVLSPILLLFSLSLILNFNSYNSIVLNKMLFGIGLYTVISFFSNFIYYGFILYFIYLEKKKHV